MHFFNPAPLMRLLEVVAGAESSEQALALARAAGEAMGKVVIDAVDGPGFLVNRCNRPFGLEALKLLQERVAPLEEIDRICRHGRRLPDGPVRAHGPGRRRRRPRRLASFYEQSFGEPRWRPSPITVKHGRRRAARAQVRPRLLRLRRDDGLTVAPRIRSRRQPAAATAWS